MMWNTCRVCHLWGVPHPSMDSWVMMWLVYQEDDVGGVPHPSKDVCQVDDLGGVPHPSMDSWVMMWLVSQADDLGGISHPWKVYEIGVFINLFHVDWYDVWSIFRKTLTNFSNGCLGSYIDEERSKMWYVTRIAKPRESSNFWMHTAATGYAWSHT